MRYSITDYAERIGVSRAYLYKLAKQKKIDFLLNGKKKEIDSNQADSIVKYKPACRDTTEIYQKNGAKRKGKELGPEAGSESDKDKEIIFGENSDRLTLEKAKLYQQTKKEKIGNDVKMKTLVDFNKTTDTVFNFLRPLRDDLLEIAKRISPMVYTSKTKIEAENFINDEIERIMLSRVGNDYKFNEDLKKKIILALKM